MTFCPTCSEETKSKKRHHSNCFRPKIGDFVISRNGNKTVYICTGETMKGYRIYAKPISQSGKDCLDKTIKVRLIRLANEQDIARAVSARIQGKPDNEQHDENYN